MSTLLLPDPAPPVTVVRTELGSLLFAIACTGLAAALAFADYLAPQLTFALVGALAMLFIARALATRTLIPRTPADWPNALMVLLLPVGLWASADRSLSWLVLCKVLGGLAIFYGLAGLARTRWLPLLPWLLTALAIAFTAIVAVTTAWPAGKLPIVPANLAQILPRAPLPNAEGGGFNANMVGGALALLLPPTVALVLWGRGWPLRVLALIAAAGLGLFLLLSQSRGAWLAAAAALLIMAGLRDRRWWILILVAALLAVGGVFLAGPQRILPAVFPAVGVTDSGVDTLGGRVEIWSRALYLIQDFSFTGAGPGMFPRVVNLLYPLFLIGPDSTPDHAHNTFLQAGADFGIPGLVAHAALLLTVAGALLAALRGRPQGTLAALAAGFAAALLAYVLHGLVDATLYASQRTYILAAVVFGAAVALSEHLRMPPEPNSHPRFPSV